MKIQAGQWMEKQILILYKKHPNWRKVYILQN